ncbi:MAG: WG repeat-containing protein [Clostridia bacterium]|nr:WG repeat-containing protein [Clostridia bacterium]
MNNKNRHKRNKHNNNGKQVQKYVPPYSVDILNEPISVLKINNNTYDLLVSANIKTLNDVLVRCEKDFLKIRYFNNKNMFNLLNALKIRNLDLKPTDYSEVQAKKEHVENNQPNYIAESLKGFKSTAIERPPKPVINPNNFSTGPVDIYIKISKNGLFGFKDKKSNKIVIEPQYDEVFSFKEDLCCFQKDEKFGFLDRKGTIIIPAEYDIASSFSSGYACVYKNDKCGYIDKENNIVIPFEYDAGTKVVDGECRVKKGTQWGELHINNPKEIRWIV